MFEGPGPFMLLMVALCLFLAAAVAILGIYGP
jgi:hypothetical protein